MRTRDLLYVRTMYHTIPLSTTTGTATSTLHSYCTHPSMLGTVRFCAPLVPYYVQYCSVANPGGRLLHDAGW
jgi:hypothetical protein